MAREVLLDESCFLRETDERAVQQLLKAQIVR